MAAAILYKIAAVIRCTENNSSLEDVLMPRVYCLGTVHASHAGPCVLHVVQVWHGMLRLSHNPVCNTIDCHLHLVAVVAGPGLQSLTQCKESALDFPAHVDLLVKVRGMFCTLSLIFCCLCL